VTKTAHSAVLESERYGCFPVPGEKLPCSAIRHVGTLHPTHYSHPAFLADFLVRFASSEMVLGFVRATTMKFSDRDGNWSGRAIIRPPVKRLQVEIRTHIISADRNSYPYPSGFGRISGICQVCHSTCKTTSK
jgi:hypothetical protein